LEEELPVLDIRCEQMASELGSERCEPGPVIRFERIAGGKECRVLRIELRRLAGRGRGEADSKANRTEQRSYQGLLPPLIEYYRHFSCQIKCPRAGFLPSFPPGARASALG